MCVNGDAARCDRLSASTSMAPTFNTVLAEIAAEREQQIAKGYRDNRHGLRTLACATIWTSGWH